MSQVKEANRRSPKQKDVFQVGVEKEDATLPNISTNSLHKEEVQLASRPESDLLGGLFLVSDTGGGDRRCGARRRRRRRREETTEGRRPAREKWRGRFQQLNPFIKIRVEPEFRTGRVEAVQFDHSPVNS